MSSPPAIDFPSDDIEMADPTVEQTIPDAPPIQEPLFLNPSPSTAAGTPARRWDSNAPQSSPLRGMVARRAVGLNTPKKAPLFDGQ